MMHYVCVGITFAILVVEILSSELPSFIEACHKDAPNFTECAIVQADRAVAFFAANPMLFDDISFGDAGGRIWFTQTYKNISVYGMMNSFKILNINVSWEDGILKYTTWHGLINVVADCMLDGQFILVPIHYRGRLNIALRNATSFGSIFFTTEDRDGEMYLKGNKYLLDLQHGEVTVHYDNLFNANKDFGERINKFLNNKWEVFGKDLKVYLQEKAASIFLEIFNRVVNKVPVNKLFRV